LEKFYKNYRQLYKRLNNKFNNSQLAFGLLEMFKNVGNLLVNILSYLLKNPIIIFQMILFSGIFLICFLLGYFLIFKQKPRLFFNILLKDEKRLIKTVLLVCIIISIGFDLYFIQFITDDAFITFRYSKNLANGYGIVFNKNDNNPVEGYSNFLWVLINCIPILLGIDIVIWVKSFSIILSICSILMIYNFAKVFNDEKIALFAPLFYTVYYPFHLWTIGGLETPLFILLLISGCYFAYKEISDKSRKYPKYSIIAFSLLVLTRPEGIIYFLGFELIFILYFYFYQKDKRIFLQRIISLIFVGGIYSIYFLWRFSYYGKIFPNSYYAKSSSNIITNQGINYLLLFLLFSIPIIFLFFISIIKILKNSGKDFKSKEFEMLIILIIPITIDFLIILHLSAFNAAQGFRFALPSMPFIIIISIYSLKFSFIKNNNPSFKERGYKNIQLNKILIILAFLGLIIFPLSAPLIYINTSNTDVNDKYYKIAEWINENIPEDELIAFTDMGIIPYYTKNDYIDMWGLMDEHIAENGFDINYILNKRPALILLKEISNTKIIIDNSDFQNNYTLFYTIKLKEITQYLEEIEYELWIYMRNNLNISKSTIEDKF